MGHPLQRLYEFKGSDHRFLTFAFQLWANQSFLKTYHFEFCSLKTSSRSKSNVKEKFIDTCSGSTITHIRNNDYNPLDILLSFKSPTISMP